MLYRMFVTASSAVLERGRSMTGRGGGLALWTVLYSRAEVESSIGRGGLGTCSESLSLRRVVEKLRAPKDLAAERALRATRAAIVVVVDKRTKRAKRVES